MSSYRRKPKLLILGRLCAINYTYRQSVKRTLIISITEPHMASAPFNKQNKCIVDILELRFDNIEMEVLGNTLMAYEQAELIVEFVDEALRRERIDVILIHCYAGVSRSASVACAIAQHLFGTDESIWSNSMFVPNIHVYKLCMSAFGFELKNKHIQDRIELSKLARNE